MRTNAHIRRMEMVQFDRWFNWKLWKLFYRRTIPLNYMSWTVETGLVWTDVSDTLHWKFDWTLAHCIHQNIYYVTVTHVRVCVRVSVRLNSLQILVKRSNAKDSCANWFPLHGLSLDASSLDIWTNRIFSSVFRQFLMSSIHTWLLRLITLQFN